MAIISESMKDVGHLVRTICGLKYIMVLLKKHKLCFVIKCLICLYYYQ